MCSQLFQSNSPLWICVKSQKTDLHGVKIYCTLSIQAEPGECKFPHCLNPKELSSVDGPWGFIFLLSFKYENKLIIFLFRELVMLIWVEMLTVFTWSLPPQPCQRFSSPRKILICKFSRESKLKYQWDCAATFFLFLASFFTRSKSELGWPDHPWCLNSLTSNRVCLITRG